MTTPEQIPIIIARFTANIITFICVLVELCTYTFKFRKKRKKHISSISQKRDYMYFFITVQFISTY